MTEINWAVDNDDLDLIRRIADRAMEEMPTLKERGIDWLEIVMDVQACHANGNPLDLARLLYEFPSFDFSHDIGGILGHLNRDTGRLENFFSPRCSLPSPARVSAMQAAAASLLNEIESAD